MQESRDPAIKLFGQKIPLPGDGEAPAIAGDRVDYPVEVDMEREDEEEGESDDFDAEERNPAEEKDEAEKDSAAGKVPESSEEGDADPPPNTEEDTKNSDTLPEASNSPKTPSIDEETAKSKSAKSDKDQNDAPNSQEKTLKKPDKILPCPRCNSMDTKFCYYNNYNVNQPRYFCKACQRYWTAGGTMRNVPVGAGRRKNKNSSSHYRHITISEALQAARIDVPNGTHLTTLKSNGRVLSFGLDSPICDSMASILNLADKKVLNGTRNGFQSNRDQRIPVPCRGGKNGDDCSTSPSMTVSNAMEENGKTTISQEASVGNNNGFAPQIPCLPGIPWPYPWNSPVPAPAMYPPGFNFPLSFYPAPYWNCGVPGNWNNIPWFSSHPSTPSPNSPALGKRSRDGEMLKPEHLQKEAQSPKQKNGSVLVPKTLRIDDPNEAAKSSIWATLGIKNEAASKGGMFKGFQAKKDEKKDMEASPVLRANPAALSRSINFHENS